jgi:hypothetical protein
LHKETNNKTNNRYYNPNGWRNIFKNPVNVFTGIIAIFTILLFGAGSWQVCISRDTARRQLRAYVSIETIYIHNIGIEPPPIQGQGPIQPGPWIYKPDIGPIFTITIKNFGQTPAYETSHWTHICFREFPLTSNLVVPPIPFRPKTTIPPGAPIQVIPNMDRPLTSEQITQLKTGTHAVYILGEITYKDAFGEPRYTKFRYFYNKYSGIPTSAAVYKEGNEQN